MAGSRTWRRATAIGLAGGLLAAAQLPALATGRVTPTISISAASHLPKVTGDVLVVFRGGTAAQALISGAVTGATNGEVLRLYASQFPFKKAFAPIGGPVTVTGSPMPYAFAVTPALATRYQAELFATTSSTTPVATSAAVIVYVAANGQASGLKTCNRAGNRPVCHQSIKFRVIVPASTLGTEIAKRWFVYFGLNLKRTGIPPPPRFLRLGAGNVHVSKARRITAHQYAVTITLSFRVGNDGYDFQFFPCQRDTEAKDGLNLPGHHGCGTLKVISSSRIYLG